MFISSSGGFVKRGKFDFSENFRLRHDGLTWIGGSGMKSRLCAAAEAAIDARLRCE
jgi:hypothetical protein